MFWDFRKITHFQSIHSSSKISDSGAQHGWLFQCAPAWWVDLRVIHTCSSWSCYVSTWYWWTNSFSVCLVFTPLLWEWGFFFFFSIEVWCRWGYNAELLTPTNGSLRRPDTTLQSLASQVTLGLSFLWDAKGNTANYSFSRGISKSAKPRAWEPMDWDPVWLLLRKYFTVQGKNQGHLIRIQIMILTYKRVQLFASETYKIMSSGGVVRAE